MKQINSFEFVGWLLVASPLVICRQCLVSGVTQKISTDYSKNIISSKKLRRKNKITVLLFIVPPVVFNIDVIIRDKKSTVVILK
uniref:Secreted protein n=1 Tax=Glossina palpalis gambiensis TaxID=67801 RepID=A0A1B0AUB4_9MUSC